VHLIGIGGAGLSAIAHVLNDRGDIVTGSDKALSAYALALKNAGVEVFIGHHADQVREADLVIASSAIDAVNVEWIAAQEAQVPLIRRKDFLEELTAGFETIAVAGTHGKTTTSGMIAWILEKAELDPSFVVGGMLPDFGANGKAGSGRYFVVEADEYDRTFLGLHPTIAVVTNVEHDHPDIYPSLEDVNRAFHDFVHQISDLLIVNKNDPGADALEAEGIDRITYGMEVEADWLAEDVRPNPAGGMDFLALRRGEMLGLVRTRLPGIHNVSNALAAMAVADALGIPFPVIRQALTSYHGAGQRFEILGSVGNVTVVDDYAHHPTEIRATLSTARLRFPNAKVWAVFQPHTYSRLKSLMAAYISAFADADHVIVTEVFGAREKPNGAINGESIASQINHPDVRFSASFDNLVQDLADQVQAGEVVVTLSAGDANKVGRMLLDELRGRKKGVGNEQENAQSI
jgi:UDP-N-acetylmuramate--alanine ligase